MQGTPRCRRWEWECPFRIYAEDLGAGRNTRRFSLLCGHRQGSLCLPYPRAPVDQAAGGRDAPGTGTALPSLMRYSCASRGRRLWPFREADPSSCTAAPSFWREWFCRQPIPVANRKIAGRRQAGPMYHNNKKHGEYYLQPSKTVHQYEYDHATRASHSFILCCPDTSPAPAARATLCCRCCNLNFVSTCISFEVLKRLSRN